MLSAVKRIKILVIIRIMGAQIGNKSLNNDIKETIAS
jgi:hypothetical protein